MTTWLDVLAQEFAPAAKPEDVEGWSDPVGWCDKFIAWPSGQRLAVYQREILGDIPTHGRVGVRAVHGAGKSTLASFALLWYALTRETAGVDWKVITTASGWRQLTHYLWPEVHKWAGRIRWDLLDREPFNEHSELLGLNLKLDHGAAFAVASDKPTAIEGAHADHLLYIFDEAKAIPAETFDAAEGAFSGTGETFALAISTPGEPFGRFYDIHARKPGLTQWKVKHVKASEAVAAGRVSQEWIDNSRRLWGSESATYKNRVEGEFAAGDADGVVPLAWVELANDRWRELYPNPRLRDVNDGTPYVLEPNEPIDLLGVDVAREGSDRSVIALRVGNAIAELRRLRFTTDTMELAGHVVGIQRGHPKSVGVRRKDFPRAIIDTLGMGGPVLDRIAELRLPVEGFVASEGTKMLDESGEFGFVNKRSAAWWNLREILDPSSGLDLALPPDDRLTGDLTAPKWRMMSGGRIQVESKDDIRKRLERSTDDGDAVIMAMWSHRSSSTQLIRTLRERMPKPRERRTFVQPEETEVTPEVKHRPKVTEDVVVESPSKRKLRCKHFFGTPNPGTNERRCNTCGKTPEEAAAEDSAK